MIGPGLGATWGASLTGTAPAREPLTPRTPSLTDAPPPPTPSPLDYVRGWFIPTARDFGPGSLGVGYMKLGALALVVGGVVYVARRRRR